MEAVGIDPVKVARRLWKQTRMNAGPMASPASLPAGADGKSAASPDAR